MIGSSFDSQIIEECKYIRLEIIQIKKGLSRLKQKIENVRSKRKAINKVESSK